MLRLLRSFLRLWHLFQEGKEGGKEGKEIGASFAVVSHMPKLWPQYVVSA